MNQRVTDFIIKINQHGLIRWMPDKQFLQLIYYCRLGKRLDLKNPKTFNEKLQWIKLYDRRPEYTTMVDKYLVKDYVANLIGEQYIIPTLGVWDRFEDIDFTKLPNQFVLKCTHDSGGLVICRDKSKFDVEKARGKISECLKKNYYWHGREWPYKNVKPRIIAEKYMEDSSSKVIKDNGDFAEGSLTDYKFYCFNGKVRLMMMASNRFTSKNTTFDYFDRDFNWVEMTWGHPRSSKKPDKPTQFEKMIELAEIISKVLPEARVDLYQSGNNIYFGEITFFDGSGMDAIEPEEMNNVMGGWLELPEKRHG